MEVRMVVVVVEEGGGEKAGWKCEWCVVVVEEGGRVGGEVLKAWWVRRWSLVVLRL